MTLHHPLQGLVANAEQDRICPIRYLHNPLQSTPSYLHQDHLFFPGGDSGICSADQRLFNTINPFNGKIPYCSSISNVYESSFWREAMEASRTFIHLLATEKHAFDPPVQNGVTIKNIARRELRPGFKHRTLRATAYMYPFCVDARRLELLGIFMVMLFLFDDKCESADKKEIPLLLSDFCQRLDNPECTPKMASTPLQAYLDAVIMDIHAADADAGNGGAEVYREMRNALTALRPLEPLTSIGAYLKFRHQNISAAWVFASVKFSLASNVDVHQPAIGRFMEWAADHLSITNDLYSYEKEARDFRNEACPDLLNIVAVVQSLLSLPDECAALEMAYTLLLQREQWMQQELKRLEASRSVDEETWNFLRGVWSCLAGNVFFSMTCVRYGGEKARVAKGMNVAQKYDCVVTKEHEVNGTKNSDSAYSDDA